MSDMRHKQIAIETFEPYEKGLPFLKKWSEEVLGTELQLDDDLAKYQELVTIFFQIIHCDRASKHLNEALRALENKTILQFLALKGCHVYIEHLQIKPADLDTIINGMSPLQLAVARGNLLTTKVLLNKGADPSMKNVNGESLLFASLMLPVLHHSHMKDNKEAIFLLLLPLIKDAFQARSQSGNTLLHFMAIYGYDLLIQKTIQENKKLALITNNLGQCPIHSAILNGQHEAVKQLIAIEGAENLTDARGRNALHYAAVHGDSEMMAICLDSSLPIDALSIQHQTPLILATIADKPAAVKALLDKGAAVNLEDFEDMKALDYAVQAHAVDIIGMLKTK